MPRRSRTGWGAAGGSGRARAESEADACDRTTASFGRRRQQQQQQRALLRGRQAGSIAGSSSSSSSAGRSAASRGEAVRSRREGWRLAVSVGWFGLVDRSARAALALSSSCALLAGTCIASPAGQNGTSRCQLGPSPLLPTTHTPSTRHTRQPRSTSHQQRSTFSRLSLTPFRRSRRPLRISSRLRRTPPSQVISLRIRHPSPPSPSSDVASQLAGRPARPRARHHHDDRARGCPVDE
jgi:hypothetical protein